MNITEIRMLEILKELKNEYGVLAVKAEFEAEGSRTDELVKLNEIVFRADMDLFIKIGGCEAVRDLDQCRLLGASGIMAPMIETPFAMQKFVGAANKVYNKDEKIEWIINAETKTCRENFEEICAVGNGFLNTISIGRVDLSSSMGLSRDGINSEEIYNACEYFSGVARKHGLKVGFGGGISFDSIPFITKMHNLADKFETRKVVFAMDDNEQRLKKGILLAMEFETMYLKNKCDFYDRMANEDRERLIMLEERVKKARAEV